jgi:phenylacetate-coenzyme A ligase PaaK-like adenylate-forming protein
MSEAFADVYAARDAWVRRRDRDGSDPYTAALAHARAAVPFYRDRTDDDLPLVSRSDLQHDPAAFRAGTGHPRSLSSTGTTGSPLTVDLDAAAWYAVNYHFFAQVYALIGADFPAEGRISVVFVSNKPGRTGFVCPMPSLGHGVYVRLQLDALAANPIDTYARLAAPILYGKPTYLLDLRTALIRAGAARPPWSPRMLLVSGEKLDPDDERRLSGYFGAPVTDAYASTEGGLIAARPPGATAYHVFGDNVRLEVLDASGSAAMDGRGELVVSNLVNRATSVLRYRTGDHGTLVGGDGGQLLTELRGREPDTLPGGIATGPVTDALGAIDGIGDFQIEVGRHGSATSRGDGVIARFTADVTCDDVPALAKAFGDEIDRLLPDLPVTVEHLSRITPPGGKKRRYLISQE